MEAIASYRRATALNPTDTDTQHSLANLLAEQGELAEATERYQQLLQHQPKFAEVYYNLGNAKHQQGDIEGAIDCYRRALELKPDCSTFHYNLGNMLYQQGKSREAADCYRRACSLAPDDPEASYNLGRALQELKEFTEAEEAYKNAIRLKPAWAEIYSNLGVIRMDQGDLDAAIEWQQRALDMEPDMVQAHLNLGTVFGKQLRWPEAVRHFRRALHDQPEHVLLHCNLGCTLEQQGDIEGAVACYRQALQLQPDCATARFSLAVMDLLQGNFREGWEEYEARWQADEFRIHRRSFSQPVWRGEPLAGERILLHAEQGLGDTMQFVRYVPLVAALGARVVLEVQPPLRRLLAGFPGVEEVVARGETLPEFRWQCPLLSLPRIFATELENIPGKVPYLHPDETETQSWAQRLRRDGLRIGLAWAGNPNHPRESQRSIPLEHLAPLMEVAGTTFYSLQKGKAARQLQNLPGLKLVDLSSQQSDFADTAAIVANLDLVITIDTSVAHLAGAMGKPVWVLLHHMPDWRWLLGRNDSPWYPTARLFRQTAPRDWDSVIYRVRQELEAMLRLGRPALPMPAQGTTYTPPSFTSHLITMGAPS